MKKLYEILKKKIELSNYKNSFNRDFLQIEYDEENNQIFLYFIEEFFIIKWKFQIFQEYLDIYEDEEEFSDYILIYRINHIIYEMDENLLNNQIISFISDNLLIRYEISDFLEK